MRASGLPFIARLAGLLAAAALAPSGVRSAEGMVVETGKFEAKPSVVEVEFSVRNQTARTAKTVVVACTFLDAKGRPLFMQGGIVGDIRPASTAIGSVRVPPEKEIRNATCRLSRFAESD